MKRWPGEGRRAGDNTLDIKGVRWGECVSWRRDRKEIREREKKGRRRRWRGDWGHKLQVFEGMTQPLIQVFKYLMQGGIKQDRLTTELSVKTRIY